MEPVVGKRLANANGISVVSGSEWDNMSGVQQRALFSEGAVHIQRYRKRDVLLDSFLDPLPTSEKSRVGHSLYHFVDIKMKQQCHGKFFFHLMHLILNMLQIVTFH